MNPDLRLCSHCGLDHSVSASCPGRPSLDGYPIEFEIPTDAAEQGKQMFQARGTPAHLADTSADKRHMRDS